MAMVCARVRVRRSMNVGAEIFWLTAPTALFLLFLQLGSRAWIHTSFGADHGGATRRLSHWVKRLISENIRSLASLRAFASGSSFSCQAADCRYWSHASLVRAPPVRFSTPPLFVS